MRSDSYLHLVYLIRHAQPKNLGDAALRYDIPPGPPLSAAGRAQAVMAASFLVNSLARRPPSVVYTSPLDRAMQTAQIIVAQLGAPLAIDERLAEHRRDETADQVAARVMTFWHERVTTAAPDCIALVSHGSPIKLIVAALDDRLTADLFKCRFDYNNIVPHAGIWRARWPAHGRVDQMPSQWDLSLIFSIIASHVDA